MFVNFSLALFNKSEPNQIRKLYCLLISTYYFLYLFLYEKNRTGASVIDSITQETVDICLYGCSCMVAACSDAKNIIEAI